MYIFSNYEYDGSKEMSRALLVKAMNAYILDGAVSCDESGEELVERIAIGETGKPYVDGWHYFSISHSENAWAVAIESVPCGLDIQYKKPCDYERIADKVFCEEDAALVKQNGEDEFFKLWTRKEAAVKAVGRSVFGDMPSLQGNVIFIDEKEHMLLDVEVLGAEEPPFGAVCSAEDIKAIHYLNI